MCRHTVLIGIFFSQIFQLLDKLVFEVINFFNSISAMSASGRGRTGVIKKSGRQVDAGE